MSRLRTIALVVFVGTALLNLGLEVAGYHHFILRAIPVWALCVRMALMAPVPGRKLMLTALFFGSLGDLALGVRSQRYQVPLFLTGMVAFLIGHLFFIKVFARELRFRASRLLPAGLVIAAGVALGVALVQARGAKAVPLLVYAGALCAMAVVATMRRSPKPTVFVGAILFVISDSLIAINVFLHPLPRAGLLILSTYWAAQFLIAEGWATEQSVAPGTEAGEVSQAQASAAASRE